jgi:hypothetical protein
VCCTINGPFTESWSGCALNLQQCCGQNICGYGYKCCNEITGSCCPEFLRCANQTELFLNNNTEHCLHPYNLSFVGSVLDSINGTCDNVTGVCTLNATLSNTTFPPIDIFNDTYACGQVRCMDNDTCVSGYGNVTVVEATKVPDGTPFSFTYYPDGTVFNITAQETEAAMGCCPRNTVGCATNVLGFGPYDAKYNFDLSVNSLLGCAAPDEECCSPFICPVGMSCCRARSSYRGELGQLITANGYFSAQNFSLLDVIYFQQICCPTNTSKCCVMEVPSIFSNTNVAIVPYCGKGDSCDQPMFSMDSATGLADALNGQEAFQISINDFIVGLYYQRTQVDGSRDDCTIIGTPTSGLGCGICEGTEAPRTVQCTPQS